MWTTGDLPFSSPEVKNAFETAGEIFFNPDYVVGGTTGILSTNFGDSPLGLFEPRTCYLHRQASFIPNFFPEGAEIGVDVDYFQPPAEPDPGGASTLSGQWVGQEDDWDEDEFSEPPEDAVIWVYSRPELSESGGCLVR